MGASRRKLTAGKCPGRYIAAWGLLVFCLFFLAAGPSYAGAKGGLVVVAQPYEAQTLDPALVDDWFSGQVTTQIFDTLLRYKPDSESLESGLATSWAPFNGGQVWVFWLRKGVYFHDGTQFDAQAVKFNLERQGFPIYSPYKPEESNFIIWKSLFDGFPGVLRTVEILDSHTVKVFLNEPMIYFPRCLAMPQFGMISPDSARESGAGTYRQPVGTGPFKFMDWRKGQRVVLQANSQYWEGRPELDRVIFSAVSGGITRRQMLERQKAQIALALRMEDVSAMKKYSGFSLQRMPRPNFMFLSLNCSKYPFSKLPVRLALNYGINRKAFLNKFYGIRAILAGSVIPPGCMGYDPGIYGYPYELNRARRLLYYSGQGDGFKTTLLVPEQDTAYCQDAWQLARHLVENDFTKLGWRVKIVTKKNEEFNKLIRSGDYDMALYGIEGVEKVTDAYMNTEWSSYSGTDRRGNICFLKDHRMDQFLSSARINSNEDYRAKLYVRVQGLISQDAPIVPLVYDFTYSGLDPNLRGLRFGSLNYYDLSRVWLVEPNY
ncbi:MAG: ABC transporter substrate-binding protein [Chloroflexi bacterium]|nr:ABC transporter substrate-binding protein [Chloroflexota bacterium]